MAKTFAQMNKAELIAAATSLKLVDEVKNSAKDVDNITNAEYVTVLEAYKAKQDEVNADTKQELEKVNTTVISKSAEAGRTVDAFERAKLKQVMYKYIVTDHQTRVVIDEDADNRVFPIGYGNLNSGPKVWNVQLHGRPQGLPYSVAKRLEEVHMTVQNNDADGKPVVKSQPRFRVTMVEGYTQDEIDALKKSQNTRVFAN